VAFKTAQNPSASVPHRNRNECLEDIAADQCTAIARETREALFPPDRWSRARFSFLIPCWVLSIGFLREWRVIRPEGVSLPQVTSERPALIFGQGRWPAVV